ncbi:MAG: 50S ribosomal protein L13 [bacterium]|nr:50S ribosomal protein L13 [bacterium]MDA1024372.1 50S ribosomal protein L13 [bacterium]
MDKQFTRETYKVNAAGQPLGRLATDIATHLIGKHRADYVPNQDIGDVVEVENVGKMTFSGRNKMEQKIYYRHTGWPGGIKARSLKDLFEQSPAMVLEAAVSRMLPKNKLRKERLSRLKITV